jgi:Sigma-70, region 4
VALTDEQRTMLQLLLEGGQSYEDIGSLLGISTEDVRSRARAALQEIGGADPDAQVGLSDYLLGQADPIGRADAVRHLQSDPEANALAQRLVQNLRLLAPKAELPEIPEPRGGRRAAPPPTPAQAPPATPPAPTAPAPQRPGLAHRVAGAFSGLGGLSGKRRTQFVVGVAAALALVIVVIVVATSGGNGGETTIEVANGTRTVSSDCEPVDSTPAQQAGVPTIKLLATGAAADADCPPSGQMTLGATQQATNNNKNQTPTFALQANAVHLQPSADGERYLLWLYKTDTQSLPLGQETVDQSGNLTGGVPLIAQQVLLLPAFDSIRISKVSATEAQQIQQSLQQAAKDPNGTVQFVGQPVLEGSVSELGLDQLLQQAQQQAGSAGRGSGKKG